MVYDPKNLPMRTHAQFMAQAHAVQFAPNTAASERLAKATGVKGIPVLSHLPSLRFPDSFPYDWMHLVYEGVVKNLLLLWTGEWKDLDHDGEGYRVKDSIWAAIGLAMKNSRSTIPSTYGAAPLDLFNQRLQMTADNWSFWATYLGPILLECKFKNKAFYDHFVDLVVLINLCLQFEIKRTDIPTIREGFQNWVVEYERCVRRLCLLIRASLLMVTPRLYFKHQLDRLSTCPLTVHALLHIADGIEAMGPVWVYWAFPIERFCGKIGRMIKSRRMPFKNLDNRLVLSTQLTAVKHMYDLHEKLDFGQRRGDKEGGTPIPNPLCMNAIQFTHKCH